MPISTGAIVGLTAGSVAFVSFFIGLGIFLCLNRRRSNKQTKGPSIDLGTNEKRDKPGPSPIIFSPFEYQPPTSPQDVSEYSRDSVAGGRIASSPGSQALLFDTTARSNNTQSTYSAYSRDDTTSSATQWGARSPVRNSGVESYSHFLTPGVPPERENRRFLATHGPEGPSSPASLNRMPSDASSPPPYTTMQ